MSQIKCNKCNDIFEQLPSDHIWKKEGCSNCGGTKRLTTEAFILKARKKHLLDKYDYSLVKYINARIKVNIKCNNCGICFQQQPADHLTKYGCPRCSILKATKNKRKRIKKAGYNLIVMWENDWKRQKKEII